METIKTKRKHRGMLFILLPSFSQVQYWLWRHDLVMGALYVLVALRMVGNTQKGLDSCNMVQEYKQTWLSEVSNFIFQQFWHEKENTGVSSIHLHSWQHTETLWSKIIFYLKSRCCVLHFKTNTKSNIGICTYLSFFSFIHNWISLHRFLRELPALPEFPSHCHDCSCLEKIAWCRKWALGYVCG